MEKPLDDRAKPLGDLAKPLDDRKKRLRNPFGDLGMSWPAVVLFAVVVGVYTGTVASIPALEGTSFSDIAYYFEWWVIFAFIIAANCKGGWESAAKTLAFFLVSQPVIYVVRVLAGSLDLQVALMAYRATWGPATLLTLPGGLVAHLIRRQDALGGAVLGLGNAIQVFMGAFYVAMVLKDPPFHLLSAAVCFGSIFAMTFLVQRRGRNRAIALLVTAAAAAAAYVLLL